MIIRKWLILSVILGFLVIIPFVNAADATTLEWGIDEGVELKNRIETYNIQYNESGTFSNPMCEDTVVLIYHLPQIPSDVDYFIRLPPHSSGEVLPAPYVSGYWLNETPIPSGGENNSAYRIWSAIINTMFAVPIGNWSLLTLLVEDSYEGTDESRGFDVFENETIWGYQSSYKQDGDSVSYIGTGETFYYKYDGSLATSFVNMSWISFDDSMTSDLHYIQRIDPPSPPDLILGGYLLAGGAIACFIVIVIILKKR